MHAAALHAVALLALTLAVLAARPAAAHDLPPDDEVDDASSSVTIVTTERAPPPAAASTTRVTARELAAIPVRTAEDALRLVPGLVLVQHGNEGKGQQFFLRGFDASHGADFAVTLEGIGLNEWSNIHAQGYLDLAFIIPELIASVEVVRGPFTLEQGPFAVAGSADYRLGVAPDALGLRASYTVGMTNRHRVLASYAPQSGYGDDFVAAEALHDDGYGENRRVERASAMAQKRFELGRVTDSLRVLAAGSHADFGLPGTLRVGDVEAGRIGFYDTYDPDMRGRSQRLLGAAWFERVRQDFALRLLAHGGYRALELRENFTGYLVDRQHGDRSLQAEQNLSAGVRADVERGMSLGASSVRLFGGIGARGEWLDQHEDALAPTPAGGERVVAPVRALEGLQLATHATAGARWQSPGGHLSADAGLRLDLVHFAVDDRLATVSDDDDDDNDAAPGSSPLAALSPRVGLHWHPRRELGFFAVYGRGVRPPEARAFTRFVPPQEGLLEDRYTGGEPAMTASDTLELGARWTPGRLFRASLSVFGTHVARESVFDHVSGVNIELASTRRLGVDLSVASTPLPWLDLSADASLVDARFIASGRPVPLAPRLVGGLQAVATHPDGYRAGLRALGVAPRPLPYGARSSGLAILDATVGYHWPQVRLDLAVENLLDLEIPEGEYHFASHWHRDRPASVLPALHFVAGAPRNARLTVTVVY